MPGVYYYPATQRILNYWSCQFNLHVTIHIDVNYARQPAWLYKRGVLVFGVGREEGDAVCMYPCITTSGHILLFLSYVTTQQKSRSGKEKETNKFTNRYNTATPVQTAGHWGIIPKRDS